MTLLSPAVLWLFLCAAPIVVAVRPTVRSWLMVGLGALFLLITSPVSLICLIYLTSLTLLSPRWSAKVVYSGLFIPLIFFKVLPQIMTDCKFPVGLSFATFAAVAATRLVRQSRRPAREILAYLFYLPKIASGPIERPQSFYPQLQNPIWSSPNLRTGLMLLLVGLFKKFVIANRIGEIILPTFSGPFPIDAVSGFVIIFLARYYIYADFSAYSEAARGLSRCCGIELMENFRRPLWATNLPDFWRRWHSSLSYWLRDFVFFPIASSRFKALGPYPAVWISIFCLGVWHGLAPQFLLYGAIHSTSMVVWIYLEKTWPQWKSPNFLLRSLQRLITQVGLVFPSAIFLLAPDLGSAVNFFSRFSFSINEMGDLRKIWSLITAVAACEVIDFIVERRLASRDLPEMGFSSRTILILALIAALILFGISRDTSSFIYFQY